MNEVKQGRCTACGLALVQVEKEDGVVTYHPAEVLNPGDHCPAQLPIAGTRYLSFDVSDDVFEEL